LDNPADASVADSVVEPSWRLIARLLVDAFGIIAMAVAILILFGAIAAVGDAAIRGVAGFMANIATIQAFPGDFDRETVIAISFAIGSLLYIGVVLAMLALARLRRGAAWRDYIAWRPFSLDRTYLLLAVAGVVWGVGVGSIIEAIHPDSKEWFIFPKGVAGTLVSFVLVVFLGPLCEEFLFRGWFYTAIRPKFGFVATLLVSATAFAAAHWEKTHLYAAAVFPVGLLLGYARERSGSTRATFAFHGFYNFAGWILAAFAGK
jgi:membrane protease YdiL (CAAX protease family)